jgi:hypothetical protein
MSSELVERVHVPASAERVFAAATDWPGQREWIFATTTVPTRGGGFSTGDEISARTGFGPIGFTDTMTITEWDPPRSCRVRHTGKVVRGTATFAVEPLADGTSIFVWSEQIDVPFGRLGALGFSATRGVFAYFVRRSLRRFAAFAVRRG